MFLRLSAGDIKNGFEDKIDPLHQIMIAKVIEKHNAHKEWFFDIEKKAMLVEDKCV